MPNQEVLQQKKQTVADLVEKMKGAHTAVFVDYKGINVADDTALRKKLLSEGVHYSVVKNTLARFAAKEAGYEGLSDIFNGTTAMAVSEDYTAAARIICDFAKTHENFKVKAGFVDGEILDANGIVALSEIPSKEGLIAKMLGSLQSSLYGLAYVLQAKIDKESASAEA
ncbi:MAG: 50S ribosomal protein L10 [Eubacteriales bacterium]